MSTPTPPYLLEWAPDGRSTWELRGTSGRVATLERGERAWLAAAGPNAWTLQRVGFQRPRIVVRPLGQLAEIAHVEAAWHGHGHLAFASGPTYEIDRSHAGGLVVRDPAGAAVARLAWAGPSDGPVARVSTPSDPTADRFGALVLVIAGTMFLEDLADPSRPLAAGATLRPSVRSRFS